MAALAFAEELRRLRAAAAAGPPSSDPAGADSDEECPLLPRDLSGALLARKGPMFGAGAGKARMREQPAAPPEEPEAKAQRTEADDMEAALAASRESAAQEEAARRAAAGGAGSSTDPLPARGAAGAPGSSRDPLPARGAAGGPSRGAREEELAIYQAMEASRREASLAEAERAARGGDGASVADADSEGSDSEGSDSDGSDGSEGSDSDDSLSDSGSEAPPRRRRRRSAAAPDAAPDAAPGAADAGPGAAAAAAPALPPLSLEKLTLAVDGQRALSDLLGEEAYDAILQALDEWNVALRCYAMKNNVAFEHNGLVTPQTPLDRAWRERQGAVTNERVKRAADLAFSQFAWKSCGGEKESPVANARRQRAHASEGETESPVQNAMKQRAAASEARNFFLESVAEGGRFFSTLAKMAASQEAGKIPILNSEAAAWKKREQTNAKGATVQQYRWMLACESYAALQGVADPEFAEDKKFLEDAKKKMHDFIRAQSDLVKEKDKVAQKLKFSEWKRGYSSRSKAGWTVEDELDFQAKYEEHRVAADDPWQVAPRPPAYPAAGNEAVEEEQQAARLLDLALLVDAAPEDAAPEDAALNNATALMEGDVAAARRALAAILSAEELNFRSDGKLGRSMPLSDPDRKAVAKRGAKLAKEVGGNAEDLKTPWGANTAAAPDGAQRRLCAVARAAYRWMLPVQGGRGALPAFRLRHDEGSQELRDAEAALLQALAAAQVEGDQPALAKEPAALKPWIAALAEWSQASDANKKRTRAFLQNVCAGTTNGARFAAEVTPRKRGIRKGQVQMCGCLLLAVKKARENELQKRFRPDLAAARGELAKALFSSGMQDAAANSGGAVGFRAVLEGLRLCREDEQLREEAKRPSGRAAAERPPPRKPRGDSRGAARGDSRGDAAACAAVLRDGVAPDRALLFVNTRSQVGDVVPLSPEETRSLHELKMGFARLEELALQHPLLPPADLLASLRRQIAYHECCGLETRARGGKQVATGYDVAGPVAFRQSWDPPVSGTQFEHADSELQSEAAEFWRREEGTAEQLRLWTAEEEGRPAVPATLYTLKGHMQRYYPLACVYSRQTLQITVNLHKMLRFYPRLFASVSAQILDRAGWFWLRWQRASEEEREEGYLITNREAGEAGEAGEEAEDLFGPESEDGVEPLPPPLVGVAGGANASLRRTPRDRASEGLRALMGDRSSCWEWSVEGADAWRPILYSERMWKFYGSEQEGFAPYRLEPRTNTFLPTRLSFALAAELDKRLEETQSEAERVLRTSALLPADQRAYVEDKFLDDRLAVFRAAYNMESRLRRQEAEWRAAEAEREEWRARREAWAQQAADSDDSDSDEPAEPAAPAAPAAPAEPPPDLQVGFKTSEVFGLNFRRSMALFFRERQAQRVRVAGLVWTAGAPEEANPALTIRGVRYGLLHYWERRWETEGVLAATEQTAQSPFMPVYEYGRLWFPDAPDFAEPRREWGGLPFGLVDPATGAWLRGELAVELPPLAGFGPSARGKREELLSALARLYRESQPRAPRASRLARMAVDKREQRVVLDARKYERGREPLTRVRVTRIEALRAGLCVEKNGGWALDEGTTFEDDAVVLFAPARKPEFYFESGRRRLHSKNLLGLFNPVAATWTFFPQRFCPSPVGRVAVAGDYGASEFRDGEAGVLPSAEPVARPLDDAVLEGTLAGERLVELGEVAREGEGLRVLQAPNRGFGTRVHAQDVKDGTDGPKNPWEAGAREWQEEERPSLSRSTTYTPNARHLRRGPAGGYLWKEGTLPLPRYPLAHPDAGAQPLFTWCSSSGCFVLPTKRVDGKTRFFSSRRLWARDEEAADFDQSIAAALRRAREAEESEESEESEGDEMETDGGEMETDRDEMEMESGAQPEGDSFDAARRGAGALQTATAAAQRAADAREAAASVAQVLPLLKIAGAPLDSQQGPTEKVFALIAEAVGLASAAAEVASGEAAALLSAAAADAAAVAQMAADGLLFETADFSPATLLPPLVEALREAAQRAAQEEQ